MAVDLGRWKPDLHPRDSKGRFRDKWGLSPRAMAQVDRLLAGFNPPALRSDQHAAGYLRGQKGPRSIKQKAALQKFLTRDGNENIQSTLRAGDETTPDIRELDGMMRPLQHDLIVSRVFGPDAFGLAPEQIGGVEEWTGKLVQDKGYSPTNVGNAYPIAGPHIEARILVPRGTRAIVVGDDGGPSEARTVILDREQPIRLGKIQSDGHGGWYAMATVAPRQGAGTKEPAQGLGRDLLPQDKSPAIEPTPDELARRGIAPDQAGAPTPQDQPGRFGPAAPSPGAGQQVLPQQQGQPGVQSIPNPAAGGEVPAPPAKKAARKAAPGPAQQIQAEGGIPVGQGQVIGPDTTVTPPEKITPRKSIQAVPEPDAQAAAAQARIDKRQAMLDERQARLERAQEQLAKREAAAAERAGKQIDQQQQLIDRLMGPGGTPLPSSQGGTDVRGMTEGQKDAVLRRAEGGRLDRNLTPEGDRQRELVRQIQAERAAKATAPAAPPAKVAPAKAVKAAKAAGGIKTARQTPAEMADRLKSTDLSPEEMKQSLQSYQKKDLLEILKGVAPTAGPSRGSRTTKPDLIADIVEHTPRAGTPAAVPQAPSAAPVKKAAKAAAGRRPNHIGKQIRGGQLKDLRAGDVVEIPSRNGRPKRQATVDFVDGETVHFTDDTKFTRDGGAVKVVSQGKMRPSAAAQARVKRESDRAAKGLTADEALKAYDRGDITAAQAADNLDSKIMDLRKLKIALGDKAPSNLQPVIDGLEKVVRDIRGGTESPTAPSNAAKAAVKRAARAAEGAPPAKKAVRGIKKAAPGVDLVPSDRPDAANVNAARQAKSVAEINAIANERGVRIPSTIGRREDRRAFLEKALTQNSGESEAEYKARIAQLKVPPAKRGRGRPRKEVPQPQAMRGAQPAGGTEPPPEPTFISTRRVQPTDVQVGDTIVNTDGKRFKVDRVETTRTGRVVFHDAQGNASSPGRPVDIIPALQGEAGPQPRAMRRAPSGGAEAVAAPSLEGRVRDNGMIPLGKLQKGDRVLVEQNSDGSWRPSTRVTKATPITVDRTELVARSGGFQRTTNRRSVVGHDDNGNEITVAGPGAARAAGYPGHQTFRVAPEAKPAKAAKKAAPERPVKVTRAAKKAAPVAVKKAVPVKAVAAKKAPTKAIKKAPTKAAVIDKVNPAESPVEPTPKPVKVTRAAKKAAAAQAVEVPKFTTRNSKEYRPTKLVKTARLVDTKRDGSPLGPNDETTIVPEWGGEQKFRGPYMEVLGGDGKPAYGSALDEWNQNNERVPGTEQGWVKVTPVTAYQHKGEPRAVETVLKDGTKETKNVANDGDWVVRQPNGEVQVVKDSEFRSRYESDAPQSVGTHARFVAKAAKAAPAKKAPAKAIKKAAPSKPTITRATPVSKMDDNSVVAEAAKIEGAPSTPRERAVARKAGLINARREREAKRAPSAKKSAPIKVAPVKAATAGQPKLSQAEVIELQNMDSMPHNSDWSLPTNAVAKRRMEALVEKGYLRYLGSGKIEMTPAGRERARSEPLHPKSWEATGKVPANPARKQTASEAVPAETTKAPAKAVGAAKATPEVSAVPERPVKVTRALPRTEAAGSGTPPASVLSPAKREGLIRKVKAAGSQAEAERVLTEAINLDVMRDIAQNNPSLKIDHTATKPELVRNLARKMRSVPDFQPLRHKTTPTAQEVVPQAPATRRVAIKRGGKQISAAEARRESALASIHASELQANGTEGGAYNNIVRNVQSGDWTPQRARMEAKAAAKYWRTNARDTGRSGLLSKEQRDKGRTRFEGVADQYDKLAEAITASQSKDNIDKRRFTEAPAPKKRVAKVASPPAPAAKKIVISRAPTAAQRKEAAALPPHQKRIYELQRTYGANHKEALATAKKEQAPQGLPAQKTAAKKALETLDRRAKKAAASAEKAAPKKKVAAKKATPRLGNIPEGVGPIDRIDDIEKNLTPDEVAQIRDLNPEQARKYWSSRVRGIGHDTALRGVPRGDQVQALRTPTQTPSAPGTRAPGASGIEALRQPSTALQEKTSISRAGAGSPRLTEAEKNDVLARAAAAKAADPNWPTTRDDQILAREAESVRAGRAGTTKAGIARSRVTGAEIKPKKIAPAVLKTRAERSRRYDEAVPDIPGPEGHTLREAKQDLAKGESATSVKQRLTARAETFRDKARITRETKGDEVLPGESARLDSIAARYEKAADLAGKRIPRVKKAVKPGEKVLVKDLEPGDVATLDGKVGKFEQPSPRRMFITFPDGSQEKVTKTGLQQMIREKRLTLTGGEHRANAPGPDATGAAKAAPSKPIIKRAAKKTPGITAPVAAKKEPAKKAPAKKATKFLSPLADGTQRKSATNLEPGDRVRRAGGLKDAKVREVATVERNGVQRMHVTFTDGTGDNPSPNTAYWMADTVPESRPMRGRPVPAVHTAPNAESPTQIARDLQAGRITRAEARQRIRAIPKGRLAQERQAIKETAPSAAATAPRQGEAASRLDQAAEKARLKAIRDHNRSQGIDAMTEARDKHINVHDSEIRQALQAEDTNNNYRAVRRLDAAAARDRQQANLLDYGSRTDPNNHDLTYTGGDSARARRLRRRAVERDRAVALLRERDNRLGQQAPEVRAMRRATQPVGPGDTGPVVVRKATPRKDQKAIPSAPEAGIPAELPKSTAGLRRLGREHSIPGASTLSPGALRDALDAKRRDPSVIPFSHELLPDALKKHMTPDGLRAIGKQGGLDLKGNTTDELLTDLVRQMHRADVSVKEQRVQKAAARKAAADLKASERNAKYGPGGPSHIDLRQVAQDAGLSNDEIRRIGSRLDRAQGELNAGKTPAQVSGHTAARSGQVRFKQGLLFDADFLDNSNSIRNGDWGKPNSSLGPEFWAEKKKAFDQGTQEVAAIRKLAEALKGTKRPVQRPTVTRAAKKAVPEAPSVKKVARAAKKVGPPAGSQLRTTEPSPRSSSTPIVPTPTPANPKSRWGQLRDNPTVTWSAAHGRPGHYDQVDRVYTAPTREDARKFLETRSDGQLGNIADFDGGLDGRAFDRMSKTEKIEKIIGDIREPEVPAKKLAPSEPIPKVHVGGPSGQWAPFTPGEISEYRADMPSDFPPAAQTKMRSILADMRAKRYPGAQAKLSELFDDLSIRGSGHQTPEQKKHHAYLQGLWDHLTPKVHEQEKRRESGSHYEVRPWREKHAVFEVTNDGKDRGPVLEGLTERSATREAKDLNSIMDVTPRREPVKKAAAPSAPRPTAVSKMSDAEVVQEAGKLSGPPQTARDRAILRRASTVETKRQREMTRKRQAGTATVAEAPIKVFAPKKTAPKKTAPEKPVIKRATPAAKVAVQTTPAAELTPRQRNELSKLTPAQRSSYGKLSDSEKDTYWRMREGGMRQGHGDAIKGAKYHTKIEGLLKGLDEAESYDAAHKFLKNYSDDELRTVYNRGGRSGASFLDRERLESAVVNVNIGAKARAKGSADRKEREARQRAVAALIGDYNDDKIGTPELIDKLREVNSPESKKLADAFESDAKKPDVTPDSRIKIGDLVIGTDGNEHTVASMDHRFGDRVLVDANGNEIWRGPENRSLVTRVTEARRPEPVKALPEKPVISRRTPSVETVRKNLLAADGPEGRQQILDSMHDDVGLPQWRSLARKLGGTGTPRTKQDAKDDIARLFDRGHGSVPRKSLSDQLRDADVSMAPKRGRWDYHGAEIDGAAGATPDDPEALRTRANKFESDAATSRQLADMVEANRNDQPDRVQALRDGADNYDKAAKVFRRRADTIDKGRVAANNDRTPEPAKTMPDVVPTMERNNKETLNKYRDMTRDQYDALSPGQKKEADDALGKIRDSGDQTPYTIPSNRTSMGTTIRGLKDSPDVTESKAILRRFKAVKAEPVDRSPAAAVRKIDEIKARTDLTPDQKASGIRIALSGKSKTELRDIATEGKLPWAEHTTLDKNRDRMARDAVGLGPAPRKAAARKAPSGTAESRAAAKARDEAQMANIRQQLQASKERNARPAGPTPAPKVNESESLGNMYEGNNMRMHGDSPTMETARAYAAAGRNGSANRMVDLRRRATTPGPDGISPQQVVDELRAIRAGETDPKFQHQLDDAIARIDAPQYPMPELPANTPPAARKLIEELQQIPYARKRETNYDPATRTLPERHAGGNVSGPSLVEQVAQVYRDAAAGKRDDGGRSPAERVQNILRNKTHESNEASFRIWALADAFNAVDAPGGGKKASPLTEELRSWERGTLPSVTPAEKAAKDVIQAARDPNGDVQAARTRLEGRQQLARTERANGEMNLARDLLQVGSDSNNNDTFLTAMRERITGATPRQGTRDHGADGMDSLKKAMGAEANWNTPERLQERLATVLGRRGIAVDHKVGDTMSYDPNTMDTFDGVRLKPGDEVVVLRPGMTFRDKNGSVVVKPIVGRRPEGGGSSGPLGSPSPRDFTATGFGDITYPKRSEMADREQRDSGIDLLRDFKTLPSHRDAAALFRADSLTRKMRTWELESMAKGLGLEDYKNLKQDQLRHRVMRNLRQRAGLPEPFGQQQREELELLPIRELIKQVPTGEKLPTGIHKGEIIDLIVGDGPRGEYHTDMSPGVADLRRRVESGTKDKKFFGGGSMGTVALVETGDGGESVRKRMSTDYFMSGEQQADAEQLMAELGNRIGAPQPVTYRPHQRVVYMERVHGKLAEANPPERRAAAVASPEGRLMAILDAITGNSDRHDNNWIVEPNGKPKGIDNSLAFSDTRRDIPRGPDGEIQPAEVHALDSFAAHYPYRTMEIEPTTELVKPGKWLDQHPFPKEELLDVRKELVAMKPQFERLQRGDWYDGALERVDALIKRARTRDQLAAATPEPRPMRATGTAPTGRARVPGSLSTVVSGHQNLDASDVGPAGDTGPEGLPIKGYTLRSGYEIQHGTLYKHDGVPYLIEHQDTPEGKQQARKIQQALAAHRQSLPLSARGYARSYAWVDGGNPEDDLFAQRHGLPAGDFQSEAVSDQTGGTTLYNRSSYGVRGVLGVLDHEFAHTMDIGESGRGRGSLSPRWTAAAKADDVSRGKLFDVSIAEGSHTPVRLTAAPKSEEVKFPHGVTDYGTASPQEDYSEAFRLYHGGPLGTARLTASGPEEPIWFRDLFPARAAIFDRAMPDFAAQQQAEIAKVRSLSSTRRMPAYRKLADARGGDTRHVAFRDLYKMPAVQPRAMRGAQPAIDTNPPGSVDIASVSPSQRPAAIHNGVVTGLLPRQRNFADVVTRDTGSAGLPVRDVTFETGNGNLYTIRNGRAWRFGDVTYVLEDNGSGHPEYGQNTLNVLYDEMHKLPPDMRQLQRSVVVLDSTNPDDSLFAQHYEIEGFKSAASAGGGTTYLWNRRNRTGNELNLRPAFRHEFGHHVDQRHRISDSPTWAAAVDARLDGTGFATFTPSSEITAQHDIRVQPNLKAPFPNGITSYGMAAPREDFAEALALYTAGPIGTGARTPGEKEVPVWFRDIWPQRAAILDRIFPDFARQQQDDVARERGGGVLSRRMARRVQETTPQSATWKLDLSGRRSTVPKSQPRELIDVTGDQLPNLEVPEGGELVIRNLHLRDGVGGPRYTVKKAYVTRRGGQIYVIDSDALAVSENWRKGAIDAIEELHIGVPPEMLQHQRGYVIVGGSNPTDAYFQANYDPGYTTLGSAGGGDGMTYLWRRTFKPPLHTREDKQVRHTVVHENSHNVDSALGWPSRTPEWAQAAKGDAVHRERVLDFKPNARDKEEFTVRFRSENLPPTKYGEPFNDGVTDYGLTSPEEDFAEALAMYQYGPIGTARLSPGGPEETVWFRDLFPERTAFLDQRFPQFAQSQLASIRRRRPDRPVPFA